MSSGASGDGLPVWSVGGADVLVSADLGTFAAATWTRIDCVGGAGGCDTGANAFAGSFRADAGLLRLNRRPFASAGADGDDLLDALGAAQVESVLSAAARGTGRASGRSGR